MAKAQTTAQPVPGKSYAKRMCNHVAAALVVYTLMLIFVVSPAMEGTDSILPYFFLVILVGVAILPLRNMEKHWQKLEKTELSDHSLASRFQTDLAKLWVGAISLPILFSLIIRGFSFLG